MIIVLEVVVTIISYGMFDSDSPDAWAINLMGL